MTAILQERTVTRTRVATGPLPHFMSGGPMSATCHEFRRAEGGEYEYRVKVPSATKNQLDKWIREVVLEALTPQNNSWIPVSAPVGATTRGLEAAGYRISDQSPTSVDVRWPTKVAR